MGDIELIRKCKNGDKAAFQELISRYHPFVLKFLVKLTQNEQLAEDLTQEVFLKVIRNIERFDIYGKAKFSTYVITISRNTYVDYLRKEKRFFQFNSIDDGAFEELAIPGFEDLLVDRMSRIDIIEQLENLTEEQKVVIKLKYIEGLTLKEIGEKLNIEPNTVKSRIHNGITKLKKLLNLRGDENDR